MDIRASLDDCSSGGSTVHSNFIMMNCVELCYEMAETDQGDSNSLPIPTAVYASCGESISGCCIERTKWCNGENGRAIKLEQWTENLSGECEGTISSPCHPFGTQANCISRCN